MDNTNNLRAQLKVTVVGGSGSGSISEYIESCDINEAGELLFYTNTGRVLNAGKLPAGELTEKHYQDIIQYINEQAASGDTNVFTEEVYKDFIEYINNHIKDGDVFTDEFYDTIIDYINEHPRDLDIADIPPYVAVKKTDSTVTVHARRYDEIAEVWAEKVTTITLDEDGYPDTVTQDDGTTTSLTWEGFD